ncbi:MAG: hypothetical protein COV47_04435 [Candidatus Diapherotrites archaeon CG11_big_fil_rev_8_21_14_0_20_37_9]|nr:MAG: hypothetical protein COV47_04435 [Candidatus Diapherotrites archaeon CG11_big_fil_rev_8_21_14_0_20_37_9]
MDRKGQGALEYLLLIGGAVLIAVIVISLLLNISSTSTDETGITSAAALCKQRAERTTALNPSTVGKLCSTLVPPTVTVGSDVYDCSGNIPNCTAVVHVATETQ